jgi:hypothetical protein
MNNTTANVPDSIRLQARDRALAVLNSEPNCISLIKSEDLDTAALFIPVVTIIKPAREDFYDPIPKIGIMAKPPLMNLSREKAGIEILRTETSKRGEHIWVGHSYGQRRGPDGTMIPDDASYEFNSDERAEADIIRKPDDYKTDAAKRLHVLDVAKFGEQRAVTGAQHALICKMAKVSRAFKTPEELMRGMKVLRIDRNVNGVLADPGLRQAALGQMLGATETVFGKTEPAKQLEVTPRTVDPQSGEMLQPAPAEKFEDDLPWEDEKPEPPKSDPVVEAKDQLRGYLKRILPAKGVAEINATLDNQAATLQGISLLIDRCEAYLQKRAEKQGRTA